MSLTVKDAELKIVDKDYTTPKDLLPNPYKKVTKI